MILAIDIGNTNTAFGLFRERRLARTFTVSTSQWRTGRGLPGRLRSARGADVAIICSVVPWATPRVSRALRLLGIRRLRVVGRDVKVPLKNRYRYPRQVGQDRLVGAYAAWKAYGVPRGRPAGRSPERAREGESRGGRDVIVCDFGTAITIDVVTGKGEYLGGIIAPGLDISLDALATKTALLPKVELKEPPELLGRDTANSIRSGLLYGCVALCDGLVAALKRQYAPKATVVATGGAGALIAKHARTIDHLKLHLVLQGLYLLSLPARRKSSQQVEN